MRPGNAETPDEYVARGENPVVEAPGATPGERFFVGLRLTEGIRPSAQEWLLYAAPIRRFTEQGLMEIRGDVLRLTARGMLLSNEVFEEFVD